MGLINRNCDVCNKPYKADTRALDRGWGLTCGKSCAAKKRESTPAGEPKPKKPSEYTRLGLILSVQAEIDAMKLRNLQIDIEAIEQFGYPPDEIFKKADELRRISTCDLNDLLKTQ